MYTCTFIRTLDMCSHLRIIVMYFYGSMECDDLYQKMTRFSKMKLRSIRLSTVHVVYTPFIFYPDNSPYPVAVNQCSVWLLDTVRVTIPLVQHPINSRGPIATFNPFVGVVSQPRPPPNGRIVADS